MSTERRRTYRLPLLHMMGPWGQVNRQDSGCLESGVVWPSGKSLARRRCVRSSSDMACSLWSNTWWERSEELRFISSALSSPDLTASSPGRRRIPASSGAAPSGRGLPVGVMCRGRRSWARKAEPPCAGHRTESVLWWGVGQWESLEVGWRWRTTMIEISTNNRGLFFFSASWLKCFGKRSCYNLRWRTWNCRCFTVKTVACRNTCNRSGRVKLQAKKQSFWEGRQVFRQLWERRRWLTNTFTLDHLEICKSLIKWIPLNWADKVAKADI